MESPSMNGPTSPNPSAIMNTLASGPPVAVSLTQPEPTSPAAPTLAAIQAPRSTAPLSGTPEQAVDTVGNPALIRSMPRLPAASVSVTNNAVTHELQHQPQRTPFKLSPTQNALCGGFAGMTARVVISPIDVVKIRLQLQPHHPSPESRIYANFWHACLKIARDEGPLAFWKGNVPAELLYLCYGAVQFWSYSLACAALADHQDKVSKPVSKFLAGGLAGASATFASYPFDLLRTRFAMQGSGSDKVYPSLAAAVRSIYAAEGVRGFYQGVGPSLLQIFPYMAITFGTYELLLPVARRLDLGSDAMVCGGIAGAVAKFGVYPLDTIRKRVQVQGPARGQYVVAAPKYTDRTWWRVGAQIVQKEGIRALYRGLVPGLAKAGPSSAVTFWAFELARGWCEAWTVRRRVEGEKR